MPKNLRNMWICNAGAVAFCIGMWITNSLKCMQMFGVCFGGWLISFILWIYFVIRTVKDT